MKWIARGSLSLAVVSLLSFGCGGGNENAANREEEDEGWAVTSWGDRYEIFAEADPLVVGQVSKSHTHVTVLDGFTALTNGTVSAILRGPGNEHAYTQTAPVRPGIFSIEIRPAVAGTFDLSFRVESDAGSEDIPSGRVSVGTAEKPGSLVETSPKPMPDGRDTTAATPLAGDISFLKEQQWRIPFATEWSAQGSLNQSVRGTGRVRPSAGGEAILTAPLDGVVSSSKAFFVGMDVKKGAAVVRLTPRAPSGRSFAELESEKKLAEARLERLEELFKVEAVSEAEVDRARAEVSTLNAESNAVRGGGPTVDVRAPFQGRIAEVMVEPGAGVEAGASLARVVKLEPLWIDVALHPEHASALVDGAAGLVVQSGVDEPPLSFSGNGMRLVSRAPEVDRTTGAAHAIFELSGQNSLRLGTSVNVEVLLPERRTGIVLPSSAIIDDAGVPIVYVQTEGESLARVEVKVLARQGDRVLVEGLPVGERIVTRGGAAIRRATQLSSGPVEGHVH